MKRSTSWRLTLGTLAVWLTMSGASPLVALHVAFDHQPRDHHGHHHHLDQESAAAPADDNEPAAEHDGSTHEHPELGVGLLQTPPRPAPALPIMLPSNVWNCVAREARSADSRGIDITPRSSPFPSRTCVLLI